VGTVTIGPFERPLKRALDNSISRVNRTNNPASVNFSTEDIAARERNSLPRFD